jgi:hypothetical protein
MTLQDGTTPVVVASQGNDMFGSGGMGGFLLGSLLSGNGMFGNNRNGYGAGMGMGYGDPYMAGGYGRGYAPGPGGFINGNVQGEQTAGIHALEQQVGTLTSMVNQNQLGSEIDEVESAINCNNNNLNSATRDIMAGQYSLGREVGAVGAGLHANVNAVGRDITERQHDLAREVGQVGTGIHANVNAVGRDITERQHDLAREVGQVGAGVNANINGAT